MTVESQLKSMLVANGMFESQADKVMEIAKPEIEDLAGNYDITFNSSAEHYPNVVYKVLYMAIKPIALKWINENIPMAWYKPMFEA